MDEFSNTTNRRTELDESLEYLKLRAAEAGWVEDAEYGDYPGFCEVAIHRGMTLDDLEAVVGGLDLKLAISFRDPVMK